MNKLYQDTMTDQMRHDLSLFCYQQGYLDDFYEEPVFGHYPANLILSNEPNYHRPVDGFYYQAQGQEVPPDPVKERLSARTVVCLVLFGVMVAELVLLFWPGVL